MRAADLFWKGVIPAEVARQLGVSHQVVSDWRKAWRHGGRAALRGKGRAGRPRKLSPTQLKKVEKALKKGAEANGYTGDLWTLPRAAEVIEQVTGVSYHPGYVWYLLRKQLGWTWQRPSRRALERDDKAIEQWVKERWPQLKKSQAPARADRVRGRVGRLIAAVGTRHLGTPRPHTGAAPPV